MQKLKVKSQKKNRLIFFFIFHFSFFIFNSSFSQQLPYYTQFVSNDFMLNPAVAGTKRFLDTRMDVRTQWVGFESNPVTEGVSLNSRFMNGTMGAGGGFYRDQTVPTRRNDLSLAYSYHLKFDDVELSLGVAGHMLSYLVDGSQLYMQIPIDNAINLTTTQKKTVYDANSGILLYNDRFHIGLSALDLTQPTVNFFPKTDTIHKSKIGIVTHVYGSVGYNWSGNPDWIFENSLQVVYAAANPITIDYNLRVHYLRKAFAGIAIRLHDAVALQAGFTFHDEFQVIYSYDIVTSKLGQFQSGSHEIMLIWSSNLGTDKKGRYNNSRFKHEKYGYMF